MPQLLVVPPGGFPEDHEAVFAALGAAVHVIDGRLAKMGQPERFQFLQMLRSHCETAAAAAA